jgi:hypothetical protein
MGGNGEAMGKRAIVLHSHLRQRITAEIEESGQGIVSLLELNELRGKRSWGEASTEIAKRNGWTWKFAGGTAISFAQDPTKRRRRRSKAKDA